MYILFRDLQLLAESYSWALVLQSRSDFRIPFRDEWTQLMVEYFFNYPRRKFIYSKS